MRLADARLAASIMIPCSMIESFTGRAWLWMMKTNTSRISSNMTKTTARMIIVLGFIVKPAVLAGEFLDAPGRTDGT